MPFTISLANAATCSCPLGSVWPWRSISISISIFIFHNIPQLAIQFVWNPSEIINRYTLLDFSREFRPHKSDICRQTYKKLWHWHWPLGNRLRAVTPRRIKGIRPAWRILNECTASRAKPLLMISKIPDPLANFHTRRGDLAERL